MSSETYKSYIKFARQVSVMGLLNLFSAVQGLIFLPVITKILGAGDYGIWSQIKISMGLLATFALLGLHESLTRFLPGAKDKETMQEGVSSCLLIIFLIIAVLAFILVGFSEPVAYFFQFDPIFVKFLALIIAFESLITVLFSAVQAIREIGTYFWLAILKMFGEAGLAIGAIFLGYGLKGAVVALIIIRVIVLLASFLFVLKKIGLKIPDFSQIKDYLKFGLPTILNNFSYSMVTSADRYLIGFFLGIVFVGYYAPAYSIAMLLGFFLFPIASMLSVVLPKFFDSGDIEQVKKYISYSLKYFLLIITPAVFGVSFLAKNLLLIFSTPEIAEKGYMVVPFVASSMLLYGVSYFFTQILMLYKRTKLIANIWALSAVINILLNIVFIPLFGILAAAVLTFVSYLFSFAVLWVSSSKELKFKIDWAFIAKAVLASAIMILAISVFSPQTLAGTIIAIVFGAAVYSVFMFLFKGIGKKEIIFLKNFTNEIFIFNQ